MRRISVCGLVLLSFGFAPGARAQTSVGLTPPVDAAILDGFRGPQVAWGPGHRGIDYGVASGTSVRAAGPGTVTFAGQVAGNLAVAISHDGGVATTYSLLAEVLVAPGQIVARGTWIGRVHSAHPGGDAGLHFGVKVEGTYVDPVSLLGSIDSGSAFSLVPLVSPEAERMLRDRFDFRLADQPITCSEPGRVERAAQAPNDNVVVAIAGIGSHTQGTTSAEMYEQGPELLGYPESRIYRFSYRGSEGHDLHEPYSNSDTYADITTSARRLGELLNQISERHPGRAVDLIAHSQGGIVARAYLELVANDWDRTAPQVEHLVTFSTPHQGAPLAGAASDIAAQTATGGWVLDALAKVSALPPRSAAAVQQLAPGSELMGALSAESLPFGTRALSIAIPNDAVVPADRALYEQSAHAIVAPKGVNGHSAVVSSSEARGAAYSFLAGASGPCPDGWDTWGPRIGRLLSFGEGLIPTVFARLESALGGPFVQILKLGSL